MRYLFFIILYFISHSTGEGEGQNLLGFRVTGTKSDSLQTATKLLVLTTEHIDNLLSEWYPKIDTYVDLHGVKAIRRVSFCNECIHQAFQIKNQAALEASVTDKNDQLKEVVGNESNSFGPFATAFDMLEEDLEGVNIDISEDGEITNHFEGFNTGAEEVDLTAFELDEEQVDLMMEHREQAKGKLVAFGLEEASKLIRDNKALLCPFHLELNSKSVFPDLVRILN